MVHVMVHVCTYKRSVNEVHILSQSYKRRYIVLRRNADEGTKAVEIMEHENDMDEVECLPLTGVWTVQDRSSQNKRRYAFEVTSLMQP